MNFLNRYIEGVLASLWPLLIINHIGVEITILLIFNFWIGLAIGENLKKD